MCVVAALAGGGCKFDQTPERSDQGPPPGTASAGDGDGGADTTPDQKPDLEVDAGAAGHDEADAGRDDVLAQATCGDGVREGDEACDDGDRRNGDGCSARCSLEPGYACDVPGQACRPLDTDDCEPRQLGTPCASMRCGDGKLDSYPWFDYVEGCDDGNANAGDGCSPDCEVEAGFACPAAHACRPIVAGDGFLDRPEQCEDGNTAAGDGCSPIGERESPTECRVAQALVLGLNPRAFDTEHCHDCNDETWYAVTLQPRERLSLQITASFSGQVELLVANSASCDLRWDQVIESQSFVQTSNTALQFSNDAIVALPLRVRIRTPSVGEFQLLAAIAQPDDTCGDGQRSGNEQCDDGNSADADGCSAHCVLEAGWVCDDGAPSSCQPARRSETCERPEALYAGMSTMRGYHAEPGCEAFGTCGRKSRWFDVEVPRGSALWVSVSSEEDFDGRLTFYQLGPHTCHPFGRRELARLSFGRADNRALGEHGLAWLNDVASQSSAHVLVEVSDLSDSDPAVRIATRFAVHAAGCGDRYADAEAGEQCDDGNTRDGDGCDATCEVEAGWSCYYGPCVRPCGNGVPEFAEACDDGNIQDGDGCSADCEVEGGYICGVEAPYCRPALAGEICENVLSLADGTFEVTQGTPDVGGPRGDLIAADRVLTIPLPVDHSLGIEVVSETALLVAQWSTWETLSCEYDPHSWSMWQPIALEPGVPYTFRKLNTYWDQTVALLVALPDGASSASFTVHPSVEETRCGDGLRHYLFEDCDDGNAVDDDGCSNTCEMDPNYECPSEGGPCRAPDHYDHDHNHDYE